MSKKVWFLPLALCLLAMGCVGREIPAPEPMPEPAPEEAPVLGPNEFRLSALPDLPAFQPYTEISARYYPEPMDHLLPRDDYGPLYPFIGRVTGNPPWEYGGQTYYGLCDKAGRIVVDAVYTDCNIWSQDWQNSGAGPCFYVLTSRAVPYERESDQGEAMDYYSPNTIAPLDGSWAIQDVAGYLYAADEQALILSGMYLDWNSAYVTNYIYTPGGELRAALPDSQIIAYQAGRLLIQEPGPDEAPVPRLVDLDGQTILATEQEMAAMQPAEDIPPDNTARDENGFSGFTDSQGQFLSDQRYLRLRPYEGESGLYEFISADGSTEGLLDKEGRELFAMPRNTGWYSLYADSYNGQRILDVYDSVQNSHYLKNLSTGETSETVSNDDHWLDHLGNGWYSDSRSDHRLADSSIALLRWGEAEPVYVLEGAERVRLDGPDGDIAVISYYEEAEQDPAEQSSVSFFRLSDGQEIARLQGYGYSHYQEGLGYMLYEQLQQWRYTVVDEQGRKLLPDSYYDIQPVGDGWYSVHNDVYAGLMDKNGQWLIRFCVNNTD